jgi:hypothetical protein
VAISHVDAARTKTVLFVSLMILRAPLVKVSIVREPPKKDMRVKKGLQVVYAQAKSSSPNATKAKGLPFRHSLETLTL